MRNVYLLLLCLFLSPGLATAQGVPELMYLKFDGSGTSVPNLASTPVGTNPATIQGAMTQGSTGMFGGALVGTGTSSTTDFVNTGWSTGLTGDWTIAFWTSNIVPSGTLWYILGDNTAGSLRCFTNGVAGANNWMLRGPVADVLVTGAATAAPNMIHFVYDGANNEIRAYVDGVLNNTVPQTAGLSISGTGPFKVGGYGTNSNLNGLMDEFRIYNRALSPAEITATYNQTLPLIVGPKDLALTTLTSPPNSTATCYGANETVEVTLFSFGSDTLNFATDNAKITVNVGGPNPQTYTTTLTSGTMNPGTSMSVLMSSAFDMSAGGTYTFDGYVEFVTGGPDVNLANDTMATATIVNFTVPIAVGSSYFEDFETFTAGSPGTLANGWSRSAAGTAEGWLVESDGIQNTTNTGPIDDHTPGGQTYMYIESSSGATGTNYELYAPCLDLTNASAPAVSFWYHMFGSSTGFLGLVVKNGSSVGLDTTLWLTIGEQQFAETDPWLEATVSLTNWSGQIIQLAWVAEKGGTLSDIAIDDVNIFNLSNDDTGITAVKEFDPGCGLSATETIEAEITNLGLNSVSGPFNVFYSVNGGTPVSQSYAGTLANFGDKDTIVFTTPADLSGVNTTYTIAVWSDYPADQDAANDTTFYTFQSVPGLPFFEDFETFTAGGSGAGFDNGWSAITPNTSAGWTVENDGVGNSGSTGPVDDHTPGGQTYLYTETSSGSTGDLYDLFAPCINLAGATAPKLTFWYHMYGATMGSLSVIVLNGSSTGTDTVVWTLSGQQQTAETDPWLQASVDLSPWAGGPIELVWQSSKGSSFTSDMAIDDVNLFQPVDTDAKPIAVFPDGQSCLGASEDITVWVKNEGGLPIDFTVNPMTVTVNVTGAATATYTSAAINTGVLPVGDTIPVTVTTTANLNASGIFNFEAITNLTGDLNVLNDTLLGSAEGLPVVSVPFTEDFETFTAGSPGTTANGWVTVGSTTGEGWFVETDGVQNSTTTGPLDDHTPGGQTYMYTETSSGTVGNTYELISPCIDLAGTNGPKLSFWYHMFGAAMGTLEVQVRENGMSTTLWSLSGQQQTAETDPFIEQILDLTPWAGATIQVVFVGIRGTSFTSDMAIDDINIFQPLPFDAEGIAVTSPDEGCGLTSAETICFDYFNNGFDTLTAVTATFSINGGPFIPVENVAGSLNPGDTANYCFTTTADLSAPGTNEIVVVVSQATPLDSNAVNDTIIKLIDTKPIISTFPYVQDFESSAWVVTTNQGNPVITLPEDWDNLQNDGNQDWTIWQGATSSANTGPDQDHTTGQGKYLLVEDTSPFNNDSVTAVTPCFDISAMNSPKFSFWYHSNNSNTPNDENELHIDLIFNGDLVYDVIPPIAHKDNNWNLVEIDLSQYLGSVSFRFRVNNNNNFGNHDIAIDDINLVDILAQDAGITSVAEPFDGCGLTANDTLVLGLANLGTDTIFGGFNVDYTINGGAVTSVPFTDTLLPGSLIPFEIPGINFATPGNYDVVAWTSGLLGDTNAFNDSSSRTIISAPNVSTYPYSQDFESGQGGWTIQVPPNKGSSWAFGTPAKQVIQGAASGVNAFVTAIDSSFINTDGVPAEHNNQEEGWVLSPCFDFSSLAAPTLQLSVWWEVETSWDGAVIQYTLNNGLNWTNVGAFGDPNNWYNDNTIDASPGGSMEGWSGAGADGSGGWLVAKNQMDILAGEPEVQFRVVFASDQFVTDDGFAFDDIFIFDTPTDDVGVVEVVTPGSGICGDDSVQVELTLTNFGIDTASNVPVVVDITGPGTGTITGTFAGPLAPGDSANFAIGTFNGTAGGQYTLSAYTVYLGDTLLFNDTTVFLVDVTAIPPNPTAMNDSVVLCLPDSTILGVMPDTNYTFIWYDSIGGSPLAVDTNLYETPFLTADQSYYVQAFPKGSASMIISEIDLGAPDFIEVMNVSPSSVDATGWKVVVSDSYTNINLPNSLTWDLGTFAAGQIDYREDATGSNYWGNNLFWNPGAFPGFAGWALIMDDAGTVVDAAFWGWGDTDIAGFNITVNGFPITAADLPWSGPGIDASTTSGPLTRQGSTDNDDASDWATNLTATKGTKDPGLLLPFTGSGSGGGCPSELTEIKVLVSPDVPVDLGPDGVECSGYVLDATDPSFSSYMWSTGSTASTITADSSGQYYVDVVNVFGCTGSDTVNLTINPSPDVNLGPNDTTVCDMITLDAGNAGATYVWSEPGQFGQTLQVTQTGEYFVTVNLLGCEGTDTIDVTVNPAPAVSLGQDISTCIDVTLDAGNAGASFLWSTGATSQTITVSPPASGSDTITVVVTNASLCDASDEIVISAGTPPVVDLGPDADVCDSVVLDAGNPGATFTWSTGATTQAITVLTSGTYTVEVIDGSGCDNADTVTVDVAQKPIAGFTFTNSGFTYDFTDASSGATSYSWEFGDGSGTSTDPNPSYTYQFSGSYEVTLVVTNDCGSDTLKSLVSGVDIDDEAFGRVIRLYPNPTKGEFFVTADDFTADELTIEVTDSRGRTVFQEKKDDVFGGFNIRVDLRGEAEGVYLVKISDGERTAYKRVIRE